MMITTAEDTPYAFTIADFGCNDPDAGDSLSAVRIDTLPANGMFMLFGVAVIFSSVIIVVNIIVGNFVYMLLVNVNGNSYTSFNFSVRDQGSLYAASPNTLTVNVTLVNDAPILMTN